MLAIAASSVLLLSSLASAKPVPQRRSSVAIQLRPRANHAAGPNKIFNRNAVLQERAYVRNKYANVDDKASAAPATVVKRDSATSGADALTDQFDTIDECECMCSGVSAPYSLGCLVIQSTTAPCPSELLLKPPQSTSTPVPLTSSSPCTLTIFVCHS